jgi:hypothetical protein
MSSKVNDPDRPVTEQGIATDHESPRDPTATLFFFSEENADYQKSDEWFEQSFKIGLR